MTALILPIGPPGATKTSWIKENQLSGYRLGLDPLRELMTGSEDDMSADRTAVWVLNVMLRERLERGLLTVVDNTNYRPEYRQPLIEMAAGNGMPVIAVVFDVTPAQCMQFQATRSRAVPLKRVQEMHRILWKPAGKTEDQKLRRELLAEALTGEGAGTIVFTAPGTAPQLFGNPVPAHPEVLRDVAFRALCQEAMS